MQVNKKDEVPPLARWDPGLGALLCPRKLNTIPTQQARVKFALCADDVIAIFSARPALFLFLLHDMEVVQPVLGIPPFGFRALCKSRELVEVNELIHAFHRKRPPLACCDVMERLQNLRALRSALTHAASDLLRRWRRH